MFADSWNMDRYVLKYIFEIKSVFRRSARLSINLVSFVNSLSSPAKSQILRDEHLSNRKYWIKEHFYDLEYWTYERLSDLKNWKSENKMRKTISWLIILLNIKLGLFKTSKWYVRTLGGSDFKFVIGFH